ncbi:hypothetical protein F511_47002 [Dorcoceras hygrometricum]|uniref:Uncharacterized protein n=1 Tax=Dorcoceras hygrometricum TaxID=472368 RepID=A0A2Z6ZS40_9LAMI|nr:hypothetical protein F511_47002 [Dorcoceras hygrometricum]
MVVAGRERRLARTVAHSRPPALRDGYWTSLLVAARWLKSGERRCAAGCTMMRAAVRRARALVPPRFFVAVAAGRPPLRRCRDG